MQIYALNGSGTLTLARDAVRQRDYLCPECRSPVRMRGRERRQPHFFHLERAPSCRLGGKSFIHLSLQWKLLAELDLEERWMEHPFPSIQRIADLVWPEHNFIFEIQCSPIKAEELFSRQRDYASVGYQVVWIFHEQLGRRTPHLALRHIPHYYTNWNEKGKGILYDALPGNEGSPLPIRISSPLRCPRPPKTSKHLQQLLKIRYEKWNIAFSGDLSDRAHKDLASVNQFFVDKSPIT